MKWGTLWVAPPPLSLSHCRSLVVQTGLVSGLLWVGTEDRGVAD